jgi:hypothetical protein
MRKRILALAVIALLAVRAHGQEIVYDPVNHATSILDEVVNFAKWSASEIQEANTQLNTLNTYENTVLQVARMGNPANIQSLPGVSNIATLGAIYGQVQTDYTQLQSLSNPANFQTNFNSILTTYRQPTWNGFTAANGTTILPNQGSFQFATSSYQAAQTVQQQLTTLDQKKATLTQQRDQALSSLQSATTTSDVQKYQAAVTALNGAIADVNASEAQLVQHGKLQQGQAMAAQQVYQAAQTEQQAAAAYQAIDFDMSQLPSGNFRQLSLWGSTN